MTQLGTPVIIADNSTHPASVYDPGLLGNVGKKKNPAFAKSNAVTSILVSSADKSIYVFQNGDIVAEGKADIMTSLASYRLQRRVIERINRRWRTGGNR
jgi:hypothetical protein